MKIRLCYKIAKEAKLSIDDKGEFFEAYSCAKVYVKKDPMPRENYKKLVLIYKRYIAEIFDIDEKYITPITLNQYLNETEKEEQED